MARRLPFYTKASTDLRGIKELPGLTYQQVMARSKVYYYTIDGSADLALAPIGAATPDAMFDAVKEFISSRDAANFSASNPGAPIAYTLNYLKDRSPARMSYVVNYDKKDSAQSQASDVVTGKNQNENTAAFQGVVKKPRGEQDDSAYTDRPVHKADRKSEGSEPALLSAKQATQSTSINTDEKIYFAINSYALNDADKAAIRSIADQFRPGTTLSLVGSADSLGNAGYNQILAERRVNAVRLHLMVLGINPEAISTRTTLSDTVGRQGRSVSISVVHAAAHGETIHAEQSEKPGLAAAKSAHTPVFFDRGQYEISNDAHTLIRQFVGRYTVGETIQVIGRADARFAGQAVLHDEARRYNQHLATQRAQQVTRILIELGVQENDIRISTTINETEDMNERRVDMYLSP